MKSALTPFYITGGTIPREAPSYIPRRADEELYEGLLQGEFCFVLTSRQMGKSSLMVRTAARLQEAKTAVAVADLTALGQDLTPAQWYDSLLALIGELLGLEDELDDFCAANRALSPLQRWRAAIREITLKWRSQRIVIFLDEIDITRSLPFSTDEFFAAIREFYNSRAQEPELNRLTFCLLGVATPSDLIRDTRTTPFNIGRRIELNDFTPDEAAPLADGLISRKDAKTQRKEKRGEEKEGLPAIGSVSEGHVAAGSTAKEFIRSSQNGQDAEGNRKSKIENRKLLNRILYWTGGHPYLTQKLCQAVAEALNSPSPIVGRGGWGVRAVDLLCAQMYFDPNPDQKDDNLTFVRNCLLNNQQVELAGLLLLYRQVLKKQIVPAEDANATVSVLRLAGIVRREGGILRPRNRIYERVFDLAWIRQHMPGAEIRRQRAAYRRGVLRTSLISAILFLIMGGLTLTAVRQTLQAKQAQKEKREVLYIADINATYQAYNNGDYGRVLDLLAAQRPRSGEVDLRNWEWGYYWRLLHSDLHTFHHPGKGIIYSVAFSRDDKVLASSDGEGTIKFWDIATQRELTPGLVAGKGEAFSLAFCPMDANLLASGSADGTLKLWDVAARSVKASWSFHTQVNAVAFSPDGQYLAVGDQKGVLSLLDVATQQTVAQYTIERDAYNSLNAVNTLAFSPNGQWLTAGYSRGKILPLKAPFQHPIELKPLSPAKPIYSTAISPDNRTLAIGRDDGKTELWDIPSQTRIHVLEGHLDTVNGLAFSPDGKYLATGSWDTTVRLWNLATYKTVHTFIGHSNRVTCVVFSHNGAMLATGGGKEVKLWDPDPRRYEQNPIHQNLPTSQQYQMLFSANTLLLAYPDRNASRQRLINPITQQRFRDYALLAKTEVVALSQDLTMLALGSRDGVVTLRDAKTGRDLMLPFQADSATKERPSAGIGYIAFSADGKLLAVSSGDSAIVTLWDIAAKRRIGRFQHSNAANGIAFSPKDKILAIANWQGYVYLWNYSEHTGNVKIEDVVKWRAQKSPVRDVSFSADGNTLATAGDDKTVKLWNVATHREMVTLPEQRSAVRCVAFSHDGRYLASIGLDGAFYLYSAASLKEADAQESR